MEYAARWTGAYGGLPRQGPRGAGGRRRRRRRRQSLKTNSISSRPWRCRNVPTSPETTCPVLWSTRAYNPPRSMRPSPIRAASDLNSRSRAASRRRSAASSARTCWRMRSPRASGWGLGCCGRRAMSTSLSYWSGLVVLVRSLHTSPSAASARHLLTA